MGGGPIQTLAFLNSNKKNQGSKSFQDIFSTWRFWICDIEEAFWERKCIVVFPKPTFCFPFFRLEAIRRERGGEGGEGIAVKIKFIWKNWFLSFYQAERISNPIICVFTAVHFRRHVFILDVLVHLSISLPEHRRLFWKGFHDGNPSCVKLNMTNNTSSRCLPVGHLVIGWRSACVGWWSIENNHLSRPGSPAERESRRNKCPSLAFYPNCPCVLTAFLLVMGCLGLWVSPCVKLKNSHNECVFFSKFSLGVVRAKKEIYLP